jgi:hypothetical protein
MGPPAPSWLSPLIGTEEDKDDEGSVTGLLALAGPAEERVKR